MFLKLFPFLSANFFYLLFIFSDIGLLAFSVIGVSFWLFTVRTRERRYWGGSVYAVHYKSRESHLQVGRVSWTWDPQCAHIFGSLLCNVATSIFPFSGTSRCGVSTLRR